MGSYVNVRRRAKNIPDYLVYARTGLEMYRRRGNKERLRTALYFRRKLYKAGYTNLIEYITSSAANILVSIFLIPLSSCIQKFFEKIENREEFVTLVFDHYSNNSNWIKS